MNNPEPDPEQAPDQDKHTNEPDPLPGEGEPSSLQSIHQFERDTPQRITARLVLEAGGSQRAAADAAGVDASQVNRWAKQWREQGWNQPAGPPITGERGQEAAAQRWQQHRTKIGLTAGMLAGRILNRVAELLPDAARTEIVREQAVDAQGKPVGLPRHRVLVKVPAVEVYRLVEAADRLFVMADRSAGLLNSLDVTVSGSIETDAVAVDERRARVVSLLERVHEREQQAATGTDGLGNGFHANGNGSNGYH